MTFFRLGGSRGGVERKASSLFVVPKTRLETEDLARKVDKAGTVWETRSQPSSDSGTDKSRTHAKGLNERGIPCGSRCESFSPFLS